MTATIITLLTLALLMLVLNKPLTRTGLRIAERYRRRRVPPPRRVPPWSPPGVTCARCGTRRTFRDDGRPMYDYPDGYDGLFCRSVGHDWPYQPRAQR